MLKCIQRKGLRFFPRLKGFLVAPDTPLISKQTAFLVSHWSDVFWVAEANPLSIRFINGAAAAVLGVSKEELAAQPGLWLEMIHPDDGILFQSGLQSLRWGKDMEIQYRVIQPDQGIRLLNTKMWLTSEANHPGDLIHGISHDITLQQNLAATLKTTEGKFALIAEGTSDWIWEISPDSGFAYSNQRSSIHLGYLPTELVPHKHFLDLLPPKDSNLLKEVIQTMWAYPRRVNSLELNAITAQGETVHLECMIDPILSQEGAFIGLRGISRNQSLHTRMEAQAKAQAELLEHTVLEKTRELQEMNIKLSTSLKEKDQYLSKAEEFNTTVRTLFAKVKEHETEAVDVIGERLSREVIPTIERIKRSKKNNPELLDHLIWQIHSVLGSPLSRDRSLGKMLTVAERKVAEMIQQGQSAREVAAALSVSVFTIHNHMRSIRRKLGLTGGNETLRTALQSKKI